MANCKECKEKRAVQNMPESVPYIVYEAAMARKESASIRLCIVILLLIVMLVGTNIGWLIYESQFAYVEETITQAQEVVQDSGDGGENNFIGGDFIGSADNSDY